MCSQIFFNIYYLSFQGGPGASGVGYGNFGELGPLDVNLNPRNTTWVNILMENNLFLSVWSLFLPLPLL